jgi:hypothetical protein
MFATVQLPEDGPPPAWTADAICTGPLSMLMQYLPQTIAREEAEQLLAAAQDAFAKEREEWDQGQRRFIQDMCGGVSKLTKRVDALMQSRRDRNRLDELSEQMERTLALPPDAIDPDNPNAGDNAEIPNVRPGLAEGHEPGEAAAEFVEEDQQTPTGKPALSYGRMPLSYVKGAPKDGATGDLPEGVEMRAPVDPGEYAVWDPADLAHPQPSKQTPTAIGGP